MITDTLPFSFHSFSNKIVVTEDIGVARNSRKNSIIYLYNYYLDTGIMNIGKTKNHVYLINVNDLILNIRKFSKMKKFIQGCIDYGVPFVLTSMSKNKQSIRGKREIIAVGILLGLNQIQSKNSIELINHD